MNYEFTDAQKKIYKEVIAECNDFKKTYVEFLRRQDESFKNGNDVLDTTSLVDIIKNKNYKYLTKNRFLMEELIHSIKNNFVNLDFKVSKLTLKGEYQFGKYVRLPFFGWIETIFKINRLKDVYFLVSENGILTVSKSPCIILTDEKCKELDKKYTEKSKNKEI